MNQEWKTAFNNALTESNIHSIAAPSARKHFSSMVLRKTLEQLKLPESRIKWFMESTEGTPRQRVESAFKRQV